MKQIKEFIQKNLKWILMGICIILAIIMFRQCDTISKYKQDNARLENNVLAMGDTLKNWKTKDGINMATMRALQLRADELSDSLKLERGKEPVTILKYVAGLHDTVYAQVRVIHDTMYIEEIWSDVGWLTAKDSSVWKNSFRFLEASIPYAVNCETGKVEETGNAEIDLEQSIWIDSDIYRDKKGHTWMELKSDYPSIRFSNGTAIEVVSQKQAYKNRKQFGLGLGLQVGYGVTFPGGSVKMSPYVGLGVSLNWNPRFLQF